MLYHGSKTLIKGKLEPRQCYEDFKAVFATDDYWYALIRCGNFDIHNFAIREDYIEDGRYQMIEIYPGMFEYLFDRPGYIYKVSNDDFRFNHDTEYISNDYVEIKEVEYIPNIWQKILENSEHYDIVYYENSNKAWSKVTGGREGYLQRKRLALQNRVEI